MNKLLVGVAGLALAAASFASAQVTQIKPSDWPAYGRDAGGQRYSPLKQITPQNVDKLQVAWTYHMNPDPSQRVRVSSTATPLVIDGKMFMPTPFGRVVALDPTTGKELWSYSLPEGDTPALRGIGYWPGDKAHGPRLIFGTTRGLIIAIDAATGKPSAGFGANGVVDSKTPDVMNGLPDAAYGYSAPPSIYKNLAIFGSKVQERPSKGAAGDARAWDIVTGKPVWSFHSIPREGEPNHGTWEGDGWKQRSGVNQWNQSTVDAERGIVYLSFGAPTYDRYGGDHKGANLYSSSVVAVNAANGKYIWHFQTTHHDIWDLDPEVAADIVECCKTVVEMEDKFIDLAFEAGDVQGMTPHDIKQYIRFIADWRLRQLDLPEVYGIKENPLPWLQSLLSGVEHANFFEARATEYSKAATKGQWHGEQGVWSEFDRMLARRGDNLLPAE